MRALTSKQYVNAYGAKCPRCSSGAITTKGAVRVDGVAGAVQPMRCLECKATWVDHFALTGYGALEP